MATINPLVSVNNRKFKEAFWEALGNADQGSPVEFGELGEKTIQISGTVGGATIAVEGSMDGTTWFALTDDGSTAIAAVGGFRIYENPKFIRPTTTGGTTTDLDFRLGASLLVG